METGEIRRYVQNHGRKIELKVLEEMLWAIQDEVAHAIRDNHETEPKKRAEHKNPSAIHVINDVLHAYFLRPVAWRDEFRREGRADRHARQRLAEAVKIDPAGSVAADAGPRRRGNVHPAPDGGSIGRRRRRKDRGGDRKAIGHDGIPLG